MPTDSISPEGTAPVVVAVSLSPGHDMSKSNQEQVTLIEGHGVEGDIHAGATVKHRSRDQSKPNLRQVHLIHSELHDELRDAGFDMAPGQMGENITTRGIALLDLPEGTVLKLGDTARVRVTGLRHPCTQLDGLQDGLMQAVLGRDADGTVLLKAGVMGVVEASGDVRAGDPISVELPTGPHRRLERV